MATEFVLVAVTIAVVVWIIGWTMLDYRQWRAQQIVNQIVKQRIDDLVERVYGIELPERKDGDGD